MTARAGALAGAHVAVVGGSLGGLTAAVLLRDLGLDVTVYERSGEELQERGAGIGFLPDSQRYLVERAGFALDAISTATSSIRYLDRQGRVQREIAHRYHFSSWNTVYRGLLGAFDRERYLLGHEVVGFDQDGERVGVRLAGGEEVAADLLVAADGVGSRLRATLLPGAQRCYAGYVAWRGMVPEAALAPAVRAVFDDALTYHVYANSHVLVYPIPGVDGSVQPGQRLVNVVWYRNYLAGDDLDDLLTDRDGVCREISVPPGAVRDEHVAELRAVAAARLPAAMAEVVHAVERPFLQTVYDLDVDRMAFGRVCLLGDAGFVARPHAAAGTAKAAAEAWALAGALAAAPDVPSALAAWEPGQLAMGRQLVARTRRIGTRSQVTCDWDASDPDLLFRLREEGP